MKIEEEHILVKNKVTRVDLSLWNAVVRTFASSLSFSNLMLDVEIWKSLLQKIFSDYQTSKIFLAVIKKKNSSLKLIC